MHLTLSQTHFVYSKQSALQHNLKCGTKKPAMHVGMLKRKLKKNHSFCTNTFALTYKILEQILEFVLQGNM